MFLKDVLMFRLRYIVFLVLFVLGDVYVKCEEQDCINIINDSLIIEKKEYRPFEAVLLSTGVNLGVWGFDRYIMKSDYSYISFNSIKENFKKGFVWDNDQMKTNSFMHPYHGSFYFNAARINGFNFWQSGLFALGGSAMWEFLLENEYPSTNDIIATPIGGMALGEVLYRLSDALVDNRTVGWDRIGRESAIFLISPMRGVSRLIHGETWRYSEVSGHQIEKEPLKIDFLVGTNAWKKANEVINLDFTSGINIEYGSKFSGKFEAPYDYFRTNAYFSIQKATPLLSEFNILGRLLNYPIIESDKTNLNIGVYQHFDYMDCIVDTMIDNIKKESSKFSTPASLGFGMMALNKGIMGGEIEGELYVNGVLLGTVLSDYYNVGARDYNFGSGFNIKACVCYTHNIFDVSFSHELYRLYTWKGYAEDTDLKCVNQNTIDVQGDASRSLIHFTSMKFNVKLVKNIYLTMTLLNVLRNTNYKYYDNVSTNTLKCGIMLSYRF